MFATATTITAIANSLLQVEVYVKTLGSYLFPKVRNTTTTATSTTTTQGLEVPGKDP